MKEKVEAMPLVPACKASTGGMQHKEAVMATNSPAPAHFFDDSWGLAAGSIYSFHHKCPIYPVADQWPDHNQQ